MRVAVVGAGPAGLCAARHATAAGLSCTVFEQTDDVGGTWIYTDSVGADKYGIPIHTSMYRDLRINLPKDIVKFPDYEHKIVEESFLTGVEILDYLKNYVNHFGLRKYIKFNYHVKKVSFKEGQWEVVVLNLPNNTQEIHQFDAIFVCSGINAIPRLPEVKGRDTFLGKSLHSHDFRKPEDFRNKRVLVVGGGPSAMDTTYHISKEAKKVVLSHHSDKIQYCKFDENVFLKPDVKEILPNSAVFEDGSEEGVDSIIYATGFGTNYQFLDSSCGIDTKSKLVYPLYKYIINANHPTMAVLGQLRYSTQFMLFDLQVRFFIATLLKDILPSEGDMIKDTDAYIQKKHEEGLKDFAVYITTTEEDKQYCKELSDIANIKPLPNVVFAIHSKALEDLFHSFPQFRNYIYVVVDNENYVMK